VVELETVKLVFQEADHLEVCHHLGCHDSLTPL
jgi:hypothetical protein